jgi:hypothetical protein
MILTRGNWRTRSKTCPSATWSTINLTLTGLGSNPSLRGQRPATNFLSQGTALRRPKLTRIAFKDPVCTAQQTQFISVLKTNQLMLYREIIAVCSEIHIKHINTLCVQNVEFLNAKPGGL